MQFNQSRIVIGVPFLWLICLFLLPCLILLKLSLSPGFDIASAFAPFFSRGEEGDLIFNLSLTNYHYVDIFRWEYMSTYLRSVYFAAIATFFCLIIGYPFAYYMARSPAHLRPILALLVMLPFWTSFLLRVIAWKAILGPEAPLHAWVNEWATNLNLISSPISLYPSRFSLILGMVYTYLPFMILPLYATLSKMDLRLLEAARDLGASPFKAFWLVTVPLSKAGIIAGSMLVFIPCVGEYVIPQLLGDASDQMISALVETEFKASNWQGMSALVIIILVVILVPMVIFNKYQNEAENPNNKSSVSNDRTLLQAVIATIQSITTLLNKNAIGRIITKVTGVIFKFGLYILRAIETVVNRLIRIFSFNIPNLVYSVFGKLWLLMGYTFLYIPILFLVIYSFNDSKLMVLWTHFSFRWYTEVFNDAELLASLRLSLSIAFFAATGSIIMGTFIAYVMHKYPRFKGRSLFTAMASSPLVMPEIVIGLSLLLMFSALNKGLPFDLLADFLIGAKQTTGTILFGLISVSREGIENIMDISGNIKIWIAHTFLGTAYATVVILSRLKELDPSLEEAALDLGSPPYMVFFKVTLPNIAAALMAGWLLSFTLSFDDVVLAQFLSSSGSTTLPTLILSKQRLGIDGSMNVIATLIVFVVSIVLITTSIFMARQEKKRQREMQLAAQS